ncbi:hypothetical protein ACFL6U_01585 [Planctomycetota bacterium]
MNSTIKWSLLGFTLLLLIAVSVQGADRNRPNTESQVVVGQYAPDFNLPRLQITQSNEGQPIGILDPNSSLHLASLRGKRPVCLIMSSYT